MTATTRRGLFGLLAGAAVVPYVAPAVLTAAEIPAGQLGQWFLPEPAPALVTFSTHPDMLWPGIKSWWFVHGSDEAPLSMVDEGA